MAQVTAFQSNLLECCKDAGDGKRFGGKHGALVAFGRLGDEAEVAQSLVFALDVGCAPAGGVCEGLHDDAFAAAALDALVSGGESADGEVDGREKVEGVAVADDSPEAVAQNVHNLQPLFGFVDGIKSA